MARTGNLRRVSSDDARTDGKLIAAQTFVFRESHRARISVHSDFIRGTPQAQRVTIVHELLHLPTDHLVSDLLDQIEELASPQAFEAINRQAVRQYERMVEGMAVGIAGLLPLPSWAEPQQQEKLT